jgi:hypothetical protein
MWHWTYDAGKSAYNDKLITPEQWTQFETIWNDLVAGKIEYEVSND